MRRVLLVVAEEELRNRESLARKKLMTRELPVNHMVDHQNRAIRNSEINSSI